MEELIFEIPTMKRETEAKDYIGEFREAGSEINGSGGLDEINDYSDWIRQKINESKGINLQKNRVPASTYFVVRKEDDRIIGMVNIRHNINKYLEESFVGHIGYAVRPSERKKGYGTKILEKGLLKLKELGIEKAIIGCYENNVASKKVILKCRGRQIGVSNFEGKTTLGFEINLENKR